MIFLGCYDIESDKIRKILAQRLLEAGMDRVQQSVFVGSLTDLVRKKLLKDVAIILERQPNVHFMLLPILHQHLHRYEYIGVEQPNWGYLTKTNQTLII